MLCDTAGTWEISASSYCRDASGAPFTVETMVETATLICE